MRGFARSIIGWQRQHGRHDLPWQIERSPYRVWLSEVMLQQTGVKSVRPYFERFTARFPTLQALAQADEQAVLALWAGLGYYARARNLHRAARQILSEHGGELPANQKALEALPGIGPSTAGAILALAYDQPGVVLDGNIKRVLARIEGVGVPLKGEALRQLWQSAKQRTPARECRVYVQGMMDLGATLCTRHHPACDRCPVSGHCRAQKENRAHELPLSIKRAPLTIKEQWLWLGLVSDRIYLMPRASEGLWGGLWTPPLSSEPAQEAYETLPAFIHTFSHFRLRLHPQCVATEALPAGGEWFTLASLPPLPAPIGRLLASLAPARS